MPKTHLIIGTSAAGLSCALTLKKLAPDDSIICISNEAVIPYNKCRLVHYLAGTMESSLLNLMSAPEMQNAGITFLLGKSVTSINEHNGTVVAGEHSFNYDTLFLGMGAKPIALSFKGLYEFEGIFNYYSFQDIHNILQYQCSQDIHSIAILGAGLAGLECAFALKNKGMSVTIIDKEPLPLAHYVHKDIALSLIRFMQSQGIHWRLQNSIIACDGSDRTINSVILASGERMYIDMLILSPGVIPHQDLFDQTSFGSKNGIMTDATMRTPLTNIYAGGDIALVHDFFTGLPMRSCLWHEAVIQGKIAAHSMVGVEKKYNGFVPIFATMMAGSPLIFGGSTHDEWHLLCNNAMSTCGIYLRSNIITGFASFGLCEHRGTLRTAYLKQLPFHAIPKKA